MLTPLETPTGGNKKKISFSKEDAVEELKRRLKEKSLTIEANKKAH